MRAFPSSTSGRSLVCATTSRGSTPTSPSSSCPPAPARGWTSGSRGCTGAAATSSIAAAACSTSYYKENAAKTEDPDLKQLFTWLVEWEDGHLEQLMELEKIYQDAYWSEQSFSPM